MPKSFLILIVLAGLPAVVLADAKNPTFDEDILPIIKQHCASCHGNDKQRGGLNLATFAATMEGGSSGAVVAAGDSAKSRLYTLTAHTEEPKMPPAGNKIPQPQIDLLKLWIEQGARENAGSKVVMTKPKVDIGLKTISKGKPEGPPPMPLPGKFDLNNLVQARRPGAILALATSPWAPLVAIGGQKQVLLYNTDTGTLVGTVPYEHGQINSIKFSKNGKLMLVAGGRGGASGKAVLFKVETGEKVTEVGANETDAILSADLSPDQTMIAVGTPTKMVRIYSTADGSQLFQMKKHTDWVTSVEFSPDGVLLATGDRNGGIFIWEANTAREFHTLRGHTAMITDINWRDDSNIVASSSEDGTIRMWEMENGSAVKSWSAHGGGASSVRFAHDGRLVSTGRDKVTKLWDANGGLQRQFEAFPDLGLQAAITHDNAKIIAGDWAGNVKSWLAADAKFVLAFDANPKPLAELLKAAQTELASAEAKLKQTTDAYAPLKAAADQAAAALAAGQKAIADTEAAAKAASATIPGLKAEVDKLTQQAQQQQMLLAAKTVSTSAFAKAAAEVQDAATKNPANPMLTEAAKKAQEIAKMAQSEQDIVKKAADETQAALKLATEKYQVGLKAMTDTAAAYEAAKAKLPGLQTAATNTLTAANTAKATLDAATAEVLKARTQVEALTKK
jgi:hypothetical protein